MKSLRGLQTILREHGEMITELAGVVWKKIPRSWRRLAVRLTQDRFTVSTAVVIVNGSGLVLLLDHRIRPASGWGLPGGFLEHGEHPSDGVRREVREETGLELKDLELLTLRSTGTHIEMLFRGASDGTPEIKSREIKDFGWFERTSLPEGMILSQKAFVEMALNDRFEKSGVNY